MVGTQALILVMAILLIGCGIKVGKATVSGNLRVRPVLDLNTPVSSLDYVGVRVRIPLQ